MLFPIELLFGVLRSLLLLESALKVRERWLKLQENLVKEDLRQEYDFLQTPLESLLKPCLWVLASQ